MSLPPRANPKPERRRHFIRDWRKARGWTLDELSAQIAEQTGLEISEGQLSRIETGKSPYTQDTLEAIALALGVDAPALLGGPPGSADPLADAIGALDERQKALAIRVVRVIRETQEIRGSEAAEDDLRDLLYEEEIRKTREWTKRHNVADLLEAQMERDKQAAKPTRRKRGAGT